MQVSKDILVAFIANALNGYEDLLATLKGEAETYGFKLLAFAHDGLLFWRLSDGDNDKIVGVNKIIMRDGSQFCFPDYVEQVWPEPELTDK